VVVIDDGAAAALVRGNSLLPKGVISVDGSFERGDAVVVRVRDGREVARGLSAYPSVDAQAIVGHNSDEIESILGYQNGDELIHRDDLVVTGSAA
jgi:glutamate 5-kinase